MRFKFAPQDSDLGFDNEMFEWSKPFKLSKLGRMAIYLRNKADPSQSKHVRIVKQMIGNTLYFTF